MVDGLNAIEKSYIYQLMSNVQFPGSKQFGSQILIHSFTHINDVSMAKQLHKHLSKDHSKNGVIYQGNTGKELVK